MVPMWLTGPEFHPAAAVCGDPHEVAPWAGYVALYFTGVLGSDSLASSSLPCSIRVGEAGEIIGPETAAESAAEALSSTPISVPRGPGHVLRIIGVHGTREVLCHCRNNKHRGFERRRVYAFTDEHGNLVIKKARALLLGVRQTLVPTC